MYLHTVWSLPLQIVLGSLTFWNGLASRMFKFPIASILLQIGPEQAVCNMLNAIKGWTGILVFAAAIAIGFALILRGLAPEFSNQFQGAIRSVIVGLIIIAVLPLVATFILTSLGASGTGTGCTS